MDKRSLAVGAPDRAEALLRTVWAASLPGIAFDRDKSWRDVGIDSLKALEFVFRLERGLGRKIAFDGMEPESTAGDLLRRLTSDIDATVRSADRRTLIFFVPALGGDDQAQAEFRHAFRREVAFEVLALETAETPSRVLGDIAARADVLAREVERRQPTGDLRLAGYSHGGLVAQEMAARLEAAGRVVSLLVVLDGLLRPPHLIAPPPAGTEPKRRARRSGRLTTLIGPAVGPILQRLMILGLARGVLSARWLRDLAWTKAQNRRLLRAWGFVSILAWRPAPCNAPTLLVASEDFSSFSSIEDWRGICPRLRVVEVPGDHYHFLRAPGVTAFAAEILEAVAGSTRE